MKKELNFMEALKQRNDNWRIKATNGKACIAYHAAKREYVVWVIFNGATYHGHYFPLSFGYTMADVLRDYKSRS